MQYITHLMSIVSAKCGVPCKLNGKWLAVPATVSNNTHYAISTIMTQRITQCTLFQINAVDYSVWVLAQIEALLWGSNITGLTEDDMKVFQQYLWSLVLWIPSVLV